METVLEVTGLRKRYGNLVAVEDLDLRVGRGEVVGLLGHNGAGKTSAIECMLGVRQRDGGTVRLLGMDPMRDRRRVFSRVGVQFQHVRYQDKIRVEEALECAVVLYGPTACPPVRRMELLRRFNLTDKARAYVNELSGGERQKFSVVLALVPDPEILFLDELTTGLDPVSRRSMWSYLQGLAEKGISIILTSHYMDEVERLCSRILLLKEGRVEATGTPRELIEKHGDKNLEDVFLRYMEKSNEEEIGA
jgi:ABC-2 type transport system ATP-binding protein